ncbi:hypothetical protein ccbrp13_23400 [Ktedonobacteria bacterium brp13]|nr:hypothetical protein ccbrp13_23400 [Ktedonobacteria bacterium brp13]
MSGYILKESAIISEKCVSVFSCGRGVSIPDEHVQETHPRKSEQNFGKMVA